MTARTTTSSIATRHSRRLVLALWLAGAGGAQAQVGIPSFAAPPDSGPEPVLVEVQVGRLASRTVAGYRVRTEALLPVSQVLALVEIHAVVRPTGRLEARVDPGARRLVIDVASDTMRFGDVRIRLEPEFRMWRDGELFVGAERLGDLLGTRIVVDWADLVVTLAEPHDLPLARRVRRSAEREAFLRREAEFTPDLRLGVERPYWDGVVLDYSLSSPSSAPLDGATYAATLGADALGGSLRLGMRSVGVASEGHVELDGSWSGVWRNRPWLRQLRLGNGLATGPRARALRGIVMTNAPYLRPSSLGDLPYRADLGPGWLVEAYRGGELVAFDSTDGGGAFTLELPVRYGENPVDFVAYGPMGEIREFNRTYRVLAELLPAGEFEYALSAGKCQSSGCSATANADLRYGLSRRWTVEAGADAFWRNEQANRFHPYVTVFGNPTNSWGIELEAVGRGFARAALRYEPSMHLRFAAEGRAFASDTAPAPVFSRGRRSQANLTAFWRPIPRLPFAYLDARIDRLVTLYGGETRARLGGSFQIAEVRWFPFVRLEWNDFAPRNRSTVGFEVFALPRPALGSMLGSVWLRGGMEGGRSGLSRVFAYASRPVGDALRAELGVTWIEGMRGPTYSLVLTTHLPMLRSYTSVTASQGAPAFATQFVQGSLLWDPARGAIAGAPGPSLERAGISGQVFLDENANGVRDPGEPGLPDVRVVVGVSVTRSQADGAYRVWDVVPFEPVLVRVDSLSLRSPLHVPAFAAASVVPGPNRFRVLDIPVVRAGVVEGRVDRDGSGVAGVTLILTDRRTGARRQLTTFSDGAFYALGVRPGDYELTVEERVLTALDVRAEPVRFTLTSGVHGVGLDNVVVSLTPRF